MSDDGFETFVHANLSRLVLHVIKLGASVVEAEDAVAEALIETWKKWSEIETPGRWARLAAKHIFVRNATRDRQRVIRAVQGGFYQPNDTSDGLDIFGEAADVIRQIQQLPPRQREVVALFYDGYGIAEIAEILQLPQSTIRSNLRHARERLRQEQSSHHGRERGDTDE